MYFVKNVTVIGANGIMGVNASAIFASFGNATVYMVSRSLQKSRNAVEKAIKSVRSEAIRDNLVPCDYNDLPECLSKSDLVFESVSEDFIIKKTINEIINRYIKPGTIIGSGTSGLSIEVLSESFSEDNKKNYFGLHFFNPPYSMPLLELIKTKHNSNETTTFLDDYCSNVLLRKVVLVNDGPAFLANRIGFALINYALQLAEQYKDEGGIDYIDYVLGTYTGRAMSPCKTADFVGLDIHYSIVKNVFTNIKDDFSHYFITPSFVLKMIEDGKLGLKTSIGLYYVSIDENNHKTEMVYDIRTGNYRAVKKYKSKFVNTVKDYIRNGDYDKAFSTIKNSKSKEGKICFDYLKKYIEYSLFVSKQVTKSICYSDDAMSQGFNWCPPLALSDQLLGTSYKSKYNFESYFKVGQY